MGYDILWFACKLATCDPAVITRAIFAVQQNSITRTLEQSGLTLQEQPSGSGITLHILTPNSGGTSETTQPPTPPQHEPDIGLQLLDQRHLRETISISMPKDWILLNDSERESTWQSKNGAVQLAWHTTYVVGTGYGDFENCLEAIHNALSKAGLTGFDPQAFEKLP